MSGELTKCFQKKRGMPTALALGKLLLKSFEDQRIQNTPDEVVSLYFKDTNLNI